MEIQCISSMATRAILNELAAAYRAKTGGIADIQSVGGVDAVKRIRAGEVFDVIVLGADALAKLDTDGFLEPQSVAPVAHSPMALAIRAGSKAPPTASLAAFKDALLAARAVGISTGPSGVHIVEVLKRWGLDQALAGRVVQAKPGIPVATLVASGEVDLGFQQLSELRGMPGIDVIEDLPAELQSITTFSAAVGAASRNAAAARAFITFLIAPECDAAKVRCGMTPPR